MMINMLAGIDVSSWQGDIDVNELNVDFVIAKATQGTNYVNPYCDSVLQRCIGSGKKWGFYHFADCGSPEEEASYFVENTRNYFGYGIPVLDFEAPAVFLWGADGAKRWLDAVQAETGVKPLIYMSESVATAFDWSDVVNADYGLWLAKYPDISHPTFDDIAGASVDLDTGAWPFAAIWQFASDCRVNGYNGDLDGNVAFMDAAAWDSYAGNTITAEFKDSVNFENEKLKITVTFK